MGDNNGTPPKQFATPPQPILLLGVFQLAGGVINLETQLPTTQALQLLAQIVENLREKRMQEIVKSGGSQIEIVPAGVGPQIKG